MMVSKALTYAKFGSIYCGVEHTTIDGKEQLNLLSLKKLKETFEIANDLQVDTVAELENKIAKKQHLHITINSSKVLFKVLDGTLNEEKALATAFPNLQMEDFYFEILNSNNKTFIAICRKQEVHSILEEYESSQLNVIGFSLGNLVIYQLEKVLNISEIITSNSIIHFSNNSISDIVETKANSINYTINGLEVNNNTVVPLSGILAYYTNQHKTNTNFSELITKLKSNFIQQRIFSVGLKTSLVSVFVLLLLSFLLFSNYTTKLNVLNASLALNKSQRNSIVKLTDAIEKKTKLINDFSLVSSKASWYLDQLSSEVPSSILLSEINWQPLSKKIKEEAFIVVKEHTIIIRGISSSAQEFTNWVTNLEQTDWLDTVAINEYGTGKNKATSFELELIIKQ